MCAAGADGAAAGFGSSLRRSSAGSMSGSSLSAAAACRSSHLDHR